jgi:hypothetical protein
MSLFFIVIIFFIVVIIIVSLILALEEKGRRRGESILQTVASTVAAHSRYEAPSKCVDRNSINMSQ